MPVCFWIKAELNLFKYHLVPKMKLTVPTVQKISELVSWRLGGNRPSLIDRYHILSSIQQSSMQQCTGVTFQSSSTPMSVAPIKGLAPMHFSILQPILLLCGHASAEMTPQHFPYLVVSSSLDSFWMRSLFRLRPSYRIRSPLSENVCLLLNGTRKPVCLMDDLMQLQFCLPTLLAEMPSAVLFVQYSSMNPTLIAYRTYFNAISVNLSRLDTNIFQDETMDNVRMDRNCKYLLRFVDWTFVVYVITFAVLATSVLLWSSVLKLTKKFSSTSFNLKQEVFIRRDEEKTWRGWYL